MDKRKKQFWIANAKAIFVLSIIASVAYCTGMLIGYFYAPPKLEIMPLYIEKQKEPEKQAMEAVVVQNAAQNKEMYSLTENERDIVERVVMSEAGGEGFDGQRLVAQCILNTAIAEGKRPDEVVLTPGQYADPSETASQSVKNAVSAVFDYGDMFTDEPIRFFYAPQYVYSEWHESKVFVLEYGGHRFFKDE